MADVTNAEIDAFLAQNTIKGPSFEDSGAASTEDVDAYLQGERRKEEFGGIGGGLKAAALGAGAGATFGLSTQALVRSGAAKAEDLAALKEVNPVAYALGEVGGVVGSLFIPGLNLAKGVNLAGKGVTRLAAAALPEATSLGARVLQRAGAGAIGSAAEGALYGAGVVINDQALGDPDLNAEKIASTIGYSALMGGVAGAIFEPIGGAIADRGKKSLPEVLAKETLSPEEMIAAQSVGAGAEAAPKSLKEVQERVDMAKAMGMDVPDLPTKQVLVDAEQTIADSKFPVLDVQLEAMRDKNTFDILKAVKESDTPEGQALRDYDSLMKAEGVKQTDETIKALSPKKSATPDPYKAGEETIDSTFEEYAKRKKQDVEAFKKLDEVAPNVRSKSSDIVASIQGAFPDTDLTKVFQLSDEGAIELRAYKSSMPISKEAYKAIKEVVTNLEDVGDGILGISVEGLRNVRNSIGDAITFDLAPRPKGELTALRKSLMDEIQGKVQSQVPDMEVREMFKRYAINEQDMATLENIFGGKLNDRAELLRQAKPELLGDKIFRNSATIQEAKRILSKETFDQMTANYLAEQVAKFTDQGTFKSKQFANWLKKNELELGIALQDNPAAQKRLNAIAAKMSILPDMAPLNPSGTAKALKLQDAVSKIAAVAKGTGDFIRSPLQTVGGALADVGERLLKQDEVSQLEEILARGKGGEQRVTKLATIERLVNKTTNQISTLAKKSLDPIGKISDALPGSFILLNTDERKKEYEKIEKKLQETEAPEAYLEKVEKSTEAFYDAAPTITGSMQLTMTRATQFLKQKLPKNPVIAPLSPKAKPSMAEINKFLRYYEVVEDPLVVLKQVRTGTLTNESMETMKTVYPQLLADMRAQVTDKLTNKKPEDIPYQTKVLLSFFMEQDLVYGVSSKAILDNQASFAAPSRKEDNMQMAQVQKTSQKGLQSVTLSERSQTGTESILTRKAKG